MRRLYRERILERLIRGDAFWLVRQASRYAGIRLGKLLSRPLCGPILGTLITNYSCNLRCVMCDLPLRVGRYAKEGLDPLGTERLMDIIDDFKRIGTQGLGFTGGEPLLRKDIFQLLERSARGGMITHLNTNGTFLDEKAITTLLEIGIDSVNLSLDGVRRETHDRIRAKEGSYDEVLEAASTLIRLRSQKKKSLRLKLVLVVSKENAEEARGLVELRKELGADSIDFIPVHDFDEPGSIRNRPKNQEEAKDDRFIEKTDQLISSLKSLVADEPIDNSVPHLDLMRRAFRGQKNPIACFAGYNSLAVDLYGRIFPCVPWSNADKVVGNVRETPLPKFWKSQEYAKRRAEVDACQDCYLNCQTELNLLFNRSKSFRP